MKGAEKMKRTAANTATTNPDPRQLQLPFEEPHEPGWKGKRYLLCDDGVWHLVLAILDGYVADTQCCANVHIVKPTPDNDQNHSMCPECSKLQFVSP